MIPVVRQCEVWGVLQERRPCTRRLLCCRGFLRRYSIHWLLYQRVSEPGQYVWEVLVRLITIDGSVDRNRAEALDLLLRELLALVKLA